MTAAAPADPLRAWMHDGLRGWTPRAILALGCEEAFLATQLTEYTAELTVLDRSGGQLAQLAPRFPEIDFRHYVPGDPLPFDEARFEAIWCCNILDHAFDPAAVLRELHRVIVPGGRLLLVVPDHGGVRTLLTSLFSGRDSASARVHGFTRRRVVKLVRDAGFAEVASKSGGRKRRAGEGKPRSLFLCARREPVSKAKNSGARTRRRLIATAPLEELAFASRTPVA